VAHVSDLVDRAAGSAWVGEEPGLVEAIAEWDDDVGAARARLHEEASRVARPGVVPADRLVRHMAAAGMSRAIRTVTRLPNDLSTMAPLRDTQQWATQAGVEAFADQLVLSGPASHEVARIIIGSGRLFPSVLREELEHRTIQSPLIDSDTVAAIAQRYLEDVTLQGDAPVAALPVSQMHTARLAASADADERPVHVRVRRPGISRELRADARFSASAATALSRVMPDAAGMGPIGFVELVIRLGLESTDLRFEALNTVELAMILEDSGHDALHVAHPIPGKVTRRVAAFEHLDGVPLPFYEGTLADPAAAIAAISAITLESALVHGVFWADPSPEHLLVRPGGHLALVGVGTAGHFSPQLRRAGITFLRSVMSGDAAGQVEAMRIAGAAPDGLDTDRIIDDLEHADALQVSKILMGGEQALLDALAATVRVLLKYDIKPPVEVVLLLRTVFALDGLARRVMPEGGGLMAALLSLLPRLPELLNAAEGDV
jgi:ubiquinone biosynthesis protein